MGVLCVRARLSRSPWFGAFHSIANPPQGTQKKFVIDDEQKMKLLYDHRISEEIKGDFLGDQFKGYIFKITGGQDKQVRRCDCLCLVRERSIDARAHACRASP